jgi:hypothetical protein
MAGSGRTTMGLFEQRSIALLMREPGTPLPERPPDRDANVTLWVRSYGEGDEAAQKMLAELTGWDRAGRPSALEMLDIEAYPDPSAYTPAPGDIVVDKEHIRLVLRRRA